MAFSLFLILRVENGIVNQHWSRHPPSRSLLLIHIYENAVYVSYTVWYIYMSCFLCPFFSVFSPPFLLPNQNAFSQPSSAFLDRRRYYETYVRYVAFLGLAPAVCLHSKTRTLFLCLFVSFWLGFGSGNGCILAKSVLCAICWPVICLAVICLCYDALVPIL